MTYVAVKDQFFGSFADWVDAAPYELTNHPQYNDTQHGANGYRGQHFTALCFDQKGRRCTQGCDFMRARDDGSFPVWWVWPDQIHGFLKELAQ